MRSRVLIEDTGKEINLSLVGTDTTEAGFSPDELAILSRIESFHSKERLCSSEVGLLYLRAEFSFLTERLVEFSGN